MSSHGSPSHGPKGHEAAEQVELSFNYPNDPNLPGGGAATLAPNAQVRVILMVEGRRLPPVPLKKDAANGEYNGVLNRKLPVGTHVQYQYEIITPGVGITTDPVGVPIDIFVETPAGHAAHAHHAPRVGGLQNHVNKKVKEILESGGSEKKMKKFIPGLRSLQSLFTKEGITSDHTAEVLQAISIYFASDKDLPKRVKNEFKGHPPHDFHDLEARLNNATLDFMDHVFVEIMQGPKARQVFGLSESATFDKSDPENSFPQKRHAKMFIALCNAKCRNGIAPILGDSLGQVAATPDGDTVDAANTVRLEDLMTDVVDKLSPQEKQRFLRKTLPEAGINVVGEFVGLVGGTVVPVKGVLEGLTGVRLVDLQKFFTGENPEDLLEMLKANNIISYIKNAEEGKKLTSGAKRVAETIARCIPLGGLLLSWRDVGGSGQSIMKEAIEKAAK